MPAQKASEGANLIVGSRETSQLLLKDGFIASISISTPIARTIPFQEQLCPTDPLLSQKAPIFRSADVHDSLTQVSPQLQRQITALPLQQDDDIGVSRYSYEVRFACKQALAWRLVFNAVKHVGQDGALIFSLPEGVTLRIDSDTPLKYDATENAVAFTLVPGEQTFWFSIEVENTTGTTDVIFLANEDQVTALALALSSVASGTPPLFFVLSQELVLL